MKPKAEPKKEEKKAILTLDDIQEFEPPDPILANDDDSDEEYDDNSDSE